MSDSASESAPDARGKVTVDGTDYQLIRIGAVPPWMVEEDYYTCAPGRYSTCPSRLYRKSPVAAGRKGTDAQGTFEASEKDL